jgi:hypothetical protein
MANKLNTPAQNNNSAEILNRRQRRSWAVLDRRVARIWAAQKQAWVDRGMVGPGPVLHCHPEDGYRIERRPGRRPDLILPLLNVVAESLPAPPSLELDARAVIRQQKVNESRGPPPGQKKTAPQRQLGAGQNSKNDSAKNILSPLKFNSEFYGAAKLAPLFRSADLADLGFAHKIRGLPGLGGDALDQLAARNLLRRAAKIMPEFLRDRDREGAS